MMSNGSGALDYPTNMYDGEAFAASDLEEGKNQKRTSKYRGVCWNKKNRRWQASINVGGRYHYLGSFMSEDQAARAFDKAAYEIRGKRAKLNFPDSHELYEGGGAFGGDDGGRDAADDVDYSEGAPEPAPPKRKSEPKAAAKSKRRTAAAAAAAAPAPQLQPVDADPGLGAPWSMDVGAGAQESLHPALGQVMSYHPYIDPTANGMAYGINSMHDAAHPMTDYLGSNGGGKMPWDGAAGGVGALGAPKGAHDGAQVGSNISALFNGFGASASTLKLLPQAYNAHKLLGAVIENCRDSDHYGAAVWDGKRMHTLEGFQSAEAAEASAIDLINMLSAITGAKVAQAQPDAQPSPRMIYGAVPTDGDAVDAGASDPGVAKAVPERVSPPKRKRTPSLKRRAADDAADLETEDEGGDVPEEEPAHDEPGDLGGEPQEAALAAAALGEAPGPSRLDVESPRQRKVPRRLED